MGHAVPDGHLLIHAGDFCGRGRDAEVREFAAWMGAMPHRHKLVTPGNYGRPVENDPSTFRKVFAEQVNASVCTEAYLPSNRPHRFLLVEYSAPTGLVP